MKKNNQSRSYFMKNTIVRSAFTLIELLVVIAIIAILAAIIFFGASPEVFAGR